ncbi:glycosyltransferase [Nocardioides sp.]|uniref:glycosyltransferase n=1 Tax=Nocardioides sp. TaxID=35761 RepID=UPI00356969A0
MEDVDDIAVLLPVHAGVAAEHLAAALSSISAQTLLPREVIVVEDGPLSADQLRVLDRFAQSQPGVRRVKLATNGGAGVANQAGLLAATTTWIAKADSDDILMPRRLELQAAALRESGADLCGSAMWEFDSDPDHPTRVRGNPTTHDDIARRMRFNNPINHPTVVYRRSLALEAGGYPTMRFMQDYDLFARMLAHGATMSNLEEPLVCFRAGDAMRERRAARGFLSLEVDLQRRLRSYGLIGPLAMTRNLLIRGTFRLLPQRVIKVAYERFLSRPVIDENKVSR